MCALSSGCGCITTSPLSISCPYITHANDIDHIVTTIKNQPDAIKSEIIKNYLSTYFPHQTFIETMNSIFSAASKEVFIQ